MLARVKKNVSQTHLSWNLATQILECCVRFCSLRLRFSVNFAECFGTLNKMNNSSSDDKVGSSLVSSSLDKKTRREIANSNERRRMQSINSGFMRLKALVPSISKEKVSKVRLVFYVKLYYTSEIQATILQQTAEYIEKLEREKKQMKQLLQAQNPNLKTSEIAIIKMEEEPEPTVTQVLF